MKTISGKAYTECKSPEVGLSFSCSRNSKEARALTVNERKEKREIKSES